MTIKPGDVVAARRVDCIVLGPEVRPDEAWLAEQIDDRMRQHAGAQWWSLLPLTGGLLLMPEPLIGPGRETTYDEFMKAVDHSSDSTRRTLAAMFPHFVREVAVAEQENK